MNASLYFEHVKSLPFPLIHPPHPWTSQDIARRLGVTQSAVNSWRQGRSRIPQERLESLILSLAPEWTAWQRDAVLLAYGYVPLELVQLAREGTSFAERFVEAGWGGGSSALMPTAPGSSVMFHLFCRNPRRAGTLTPPDPIDRMVEECSGAAALPGGLWEDEVKP